MKRPELKNYQTKAFHHFDMEAYAKDLNKYIDYLESLEKAAPDLLEALEAMVDAYSYWGNPDRSIPIEERTKKASELALNAIQKAKP